MNENTWHYYLTAYLDEEGNQDKGPYIMAQSYYEADEIALTTEINRTLLVIGVLAYKDPDSFFLGTIYTN